MPILKIIPSNNWINFVFSLGLALLLNACTTISDPMLQQGPTMAQVYDEAMRQSNGDTLDTARQEVNPTGINKVVLPVTNNQTNLSAYTRTSENEINNLFPLLPNPQLVMYVYPHLAGGDVAPVPGYSTAFSLYKDTPYALLGEVSPN